MANDIPGKTKAELDEVIQKLEKRSQKDLRIIRKATTIMTHSGTHTTGGFWAAIFGGPVGAIAGASLSSKQNEAEE